MPPASGNAVQKDGALVGVAFDNRVPRDQVCYTCHKDYTMYGDISAKWRGMHHVYAQYIGRTPEPRELKLYSPYNNRECLHCHAGSRSFEEATPHNRQPEQMIAIKNNTMSCMAGDCHEFVHDVESIDEQTFWKGGSDGTPEN